MKTLLIAILCCGVGILLTLHLILDAKREHRVDITVEALTDDMLAINVDATLTDAVRMTVVNNVIDSVLRASTGFAGGKALSEFSDFEGDSTVIMIMLSRK